MKIVAAHRIFTSGSNSYISDYSMSCGILIVYNYNNYNIVKAKYQEKGSMLHM